MITHPANQELVYACKEGNLQSVQKCFLNNPSIGPHYLTDAVLMAQGRTEILDYLFDKISTHNDCNVVIDNLINQCPLDELKQATKYLSDSERKILLVNAVYKENDHLCDYLLNIGTKTTVNCLCAAIEVENKDLLLKFITLVNPKTHDNWALRMAVDNQWEEGVDILWGVSDPAQALAFMKAQTYMTAVDYQMIEERLKREHEYAVLSSVVAQTTGSTVKRKI